MLSAFLWNESMLSAFLWNGVSMGSHGAKVAWEEVAKPKLEGGLGIRKIKDWNAAAMSRFIWLICQPSSTSMWVSWAKINLLHKNQFWVAKVPWNCSWTWRKVLKLRDRIRPLITFHIGNGQHTSLWFDSWLPRGPICNSPNARVIYDSGLPKDAKVKLIISSNQWKWPVANSHELLDLKEETSHLAPPNCARDDQIIWNKKGGKEFSFKSAWEVLRTPSPRVNWSHLVWYKLHIPRHSFLLWLAIRKRLATQDRLRSFGLLQHMSCYFCGNATEDHDHLFFQCNYSFRIWHSIMAKCDIPIAPSDWLSSIQWACSTFHGKSLLSFIGRISLAATVYTIWRERNSRLHGQPHQNELTLLNRIMDLVRLRLLDCSGFPCTSVNLHLVRAWHLPPTLLS